MINNLYIPNYIQLPVLGKLYLGGYYIDENPYLLDNLKELNIDIIFSLGVFINKLKVSPFLPLNIKLYSFDIEDMKDIETQYEMNDIINYILPLLDKGLKEGKCVYICCEAGISRSSTIIISYLMEYFSYSLIEAIDYIKLFRPQIYPNIGFRKLLEIRERINYLNKRYYKNLIFIIIYNKIK